jgi:hypothetical protein
MKSVPKAVDIIGKRNVTSIWAEPRTVGWPTKPQAIGFVSFPHVSVVVRFANWKLIVASASGISEGMEDSGICFEVVRKESS